MKITKKWIGALAIVALCATASLFFTACGGGDGDGGDGGALSGYIDDSDDSGSNTDNASSLYGTWFGTSGSTVITKLVFAPGGRGYITMNTSTAVYAHNGQFTYTFDPSKGYINILFNDTKTSATYKISSLTSERMILINDYDMTFNMVYGSYSTEIPTEYSDNVVTNIEKANGMYVSMPKSNSRYTVNTYFHYYKKTTDSGQILLYKDAACQNLVGTASDNTYTSWGDYSVSLYKYIVKTSTSTTWVYYFFN